MRHCRRFEVLVLSSALAAAPAAPAAAFDDKEFCVVAEQVAAAAERDVGIWVDRVTRSAGIIVTCAARQVEYRRFTYAPASGMDAAWRARVAGEWSSTQCASRVWLEAIRNGWKVTLGVWSADGGQAAFVAACK